MEGNLAGRMISNHRQGVAERAQILDEVRAGNAVIDDIVSGRVSFNVQSDGRASSNGADCVHPSTRSGPNETGSSTNQPYTPQQDPPEVPSTDQHSDEHTGEGQVPFYELSRKIKTVRELPWEEWNHGLNGNPSAQSLENEYGAR